MLAKLFFNNMLELTTGVVFLMSSLYGSGQVSNNQIATIAASQPNRQAAAVAVALNESVATDTGNPKTMEAYLREEYADAPILVEIARCESNFRQFDEHGNIIRGTVDSNDVGVMQINEHYQGDTAKKLGLDIYTVEGNVAYAKHLYEKQGTQPWASSEKCWAAGGDLAKSK